LVVSSIHTVETNHFDPISIPHSALVLHSKYPEHELLYQQSSHLAEYNDAIQKYAQALFQNERTVYESTLELMHRIYEDFEFNISVSNIESTAIDCFKNKAGVCQDFSHFAIACLRSVGLMARYVSGYVDTKVDESKLYIPGKDVSHAWFAVYDANLGWIEFDPTNNMLAQDKHIRMAYGKDYNDVCPLKGELDTQGANYLKVSVDVSKID